MKKAKKELTLLPKEQMEKIKGGGNGGGGRPPVMKFSIFPRF